MRACLFVLLLAAAPAATAPAAAQLPLSPRDSALHVLNRLGFGPRPGEVEAVMREGALHWADRQIADAGADEPALAARTAGFDLLGTSRAELLDRLTAVRRRLARGDSGRTGQTPETAELRRLLVQLPELAVIRAVDDRHQLREVLADFWTNHFNINGAKGLDRALLPSFIEQTVRPRVAGRFADLLTATARDPAMLFYLDNAESVAAGARPPFRARAATARLPADTRARRPTGINENYARELLELHSLGVDGGYTQADVIAVARIFTGWSVQPLRGGAFVFRTWAHDRSAKTVLGVPFPAGRGEDEGDRLLSMLADHPATVHHVSAELCARFVSDDPPDGCVDAAAEAWRRSGGNIAEVVRAIVHSREFWAPSAIGSKVKTPFGFVVSALRALGADPGRSPAPAQLIARLGEPLYRQVSPAGYPERDADWVTSGGLLGRMNAAVALAAGRLPGVAVDLDTLVPASADSADLVKQIDRRLLGGALTRQAREVIAQQIADLADPAQARTFAVGLALGAPDFQKR